MPVISQDFSAVSSVTTLFSEANNADLNANEETAGSGVFIKPSANVPMRPADITGFFLVASTEEGKLEFNSGEGLLSLGELSDVTLTAPVAGQLLNFNGSFWENATPTLDYLDDVTITAPVAGELLSYNGTEWINVPAGAATAGLPLNSVQYNSGGLFAGSANFTFDGAGLVEITGTLSATTVTDTVATMTAGSLSGVVDVGCATVTATGAVNADSVTAAAAVQGLSVTDGVAVMTAGALSGVTDVGCATVTATGAVEGLSITDGVATMTAGSISGAVDVTATGNVALGSGASTLGLYGVAPVAQAAAIVAPTAPGAVYNQAEAQSMETAVNAIIAALQGVGITL